MKAATTSRFHSPMSAASCQRSARRRSMSSSSRSMREGRLAMARRYRPPRTAYDPRVGKVRFGPARVPSRESPAAAIALLQERGFDACEIDFEGKFWMDYEWAAEFGQRAKQAKIALSLHAPIAGFMGHAERGKKLNMAFGMLDHSAGIAKAAGCEVVVFHPGFLLGREREAAIDAVVEQLGELRERLVKKDRLVPFGVEVMGRVRELGSLDDVCEIASRVDFVQP